MTIWGCVIAFNEEQMLPGCLQSIEGIVERMVVVDGAIDGYPCTEVFSTDATVAIAEAYGAEVIPAPADGWPTEVDKRNAYLVGDPGDWYLVIDADERWTGGALDFMRDGEHYAFREVVGGRIFWTPRLVQQAGKLRYEGAHNALWRDETLLRRECAVLVDPWMGAFQLLHLRELRSTEQWAAKAVFCEIQREREREYRTRHGL